MKIFLSLIIFYTTSAYAYKIGIYTDQKNQKKAKEVIELFHSTYPFNQFELEFVVMPISSDNLKCKSDPNIKRLPICDTKVVAEDAAKNDLDQSMIIFKSSKHGGSGGSIPVITTSTPQRAMLHEYLHTLGLSDEYEYSASEALIYCRRNGLNMAIIEPDPKGYDSDKIARTKHMPDIPWAEQINSNTLITNGRKLGTGLVNTRIYSTPNSTNSKSTIGAAIGLYKGRSCSKAEPKVTTWQPGGEATIMDVLKAGLGAANEKIVEQVLLARGVRKKKSNTKNLEPIKVNSDRRAPKNIEENGKINSETKKGKGISK